MHPIERLRYVARAAGAEHGVLVREGAGALRALADDPAGLVTACRQLLARHPGVGALWWLAARMLTASDPASAAWRAVDELEGDRTGRELARALPDDARLVIVGWPEITASALPRRGDLEVLVVDAHGEGAGLVSTLLAADVDAVDVAEAGVGPAAAGADVVVLEACASGPGGVLAVSGSLAAGAVATHSCVPVWVVVGRGRALPDGLWTAVRRGAVGQDPWHADLEVVPWDLVDHVIGPDGLASPSDAAGRADCPAAPELAKPPT